MKVDTKSGMCLPLVPYLRVSSDGQAEHGYGLESQMDAIARYAKGACLTLTHAVRDKGVSGTTPANLRPGLSAILRLITEAQVSGLVVARLDRLARTLSVQEATLAYVWQNNGELHTSDQGLVPRDSADDPMRTALRQIVGSISQLDKASMQARLRAGKEVKRRSGGYVGGAPPYGWMARDGALSPLPEQQVQLRYIALLRQQGMTYRALADHLNRSGVPSKHGGTWYASTVRSALLHAAGES